MGQPEFQSVVAQAPREQILVNSYNNTSSIAAAGSETIDIFSPVGTRDDLLSLYVGINPPTGATSGSHSLILLNGAIGAWFMEGISNFGDALKFNHQSWESATNSKVPAADSDIGNNMRSIKYDSNTSLRFVYANNTNVATTQNRYYCLTVLRKQLAI